MRSLIPFLTLLLIMSCGSRPTTQGDRVLRADEPSAQTLKDEVRRALEQLNAPSLVERNHAEQRLIALGFDVLPLLPPLDLVSAVSAKQALRRIRTQLEQDAARQSIAPSRLTLKGNFSVAQLTTELEKQTRNRVLLPEPPISSLPAALKVDWSQCSFWDCVSDLEKQQLSLEFSTQRGGYVWRASDRPLQRATQTLGAFQVSAAPIESRAAADGKSQLLNAGLTIAAEPRLRPLFLRYSAADFAMGEDGSIQPFDPEARIEVPLGDGGRISKFSLSFVSPTLPPPTVAIQGKAKLVVAAAEEPIEFKDFGRAPGVSRRHGGVTVTLTNVRFKRDESGKYAASVRLQVSYDSAQHAFESHQLWVFHNHVFLQSPEGRQIAHTGGAETLFQNEGIVGVEYRFADLPEAARSWSCIYVAPTLLIEVPLEFRLNGVTTRTRDAAG